MQAKARELYQNLSARREDGCSANFAVSEG